MTITTLDTVIAMIIVLLVLSLIVQSIQTIIKKWFKLKSHSIFSSLEDLFEYAQNTENAVPADELVQAVRDEFKKLGRVSLILRTPMVDSIAKKDLMNIMDRVNAGHLKEQVDTWFDTVMQSFEERYTRHMKTVAIIISIFVVVLLNANFFQVYHNISTNDVLRNSLLERQGTIQKALQDSSQAAGQTPETTADLNAELTQIRETMDQTISLGFTPLKPKQIFNFISGQGVWAGHPASERFAHLIKVLGGYAIMVMLLSVGAPFWQDALESLFGIKNLLRQKSDTQNVEDTGGGQPKP